MMDDEHSWADELTDSGFFGTEGADGAAALDPAVIDLVDELVAHAPAGREGLLPVLLGVQRAFDRVSWRVQELVADRFGLSPAQVLALVSFYPNLSSDRRGRVKIEVCTGTGCYLRGGDEVLATAVREIGGPPVEDESHPLLSVEQERCLGLCGLAPAVRIQGRIRTDIGGCETLALICRLQEDDGPPGEGK